MYPSKPEIAENIIGQINLEEPIVVFSMPGMGKHYERKLLSDLIAKDSELSKVKVIGRDLFTTEEMFEFLKELEGIDEKVILILGICLNYGQDASWFIEQLNSIKDKKRHGNILTVIFASPASVFTAIKTKIRLISRIVDFKTPLTQEKSYEIIKKYEEKFDLNLTDETKQKIFELTGGHIGMIKNLVLELKLIPDLSLDYDNLINSDSIKGWLYELTEDLNKEMLEVLLGLRDDEEVRDLLIKTGYLTNESKIFSPLFEQFLEKNKAKKFSGSTFENILTDQEIKTYQLLKNSNSKIVSREDIAKVIWQEDWLEKYSDWAIDQLIHSLREKMSTNDIERKITTLRGKGYKLT